MKFIDELDVERVNQTLNFETSDCKITGGCDIFTTKAVASDKKLYKAIDQHLEMMLQENESYNQAVQQQKLIEANASLLPSPFSYGRRDSTSFWEQKRRMSITDSNIKNHINQLNSTLINGFGSPSSSNEQQQQQQQQQQHSPVIKSSKLNEQNLKELVMSADTGYISSSSVESNSTGRKHRTGNSTAHTTINDNENPHTKKKTKRASSTSSQHSNMRTPTIRRSSLNETSTKINIGPFGPINEPSSRRTFAYLIAILNASYPDHDFSSLEPNDFTKNSLKGFVSKFENSLYSLGKQPEEWIWEVINSHMTMPDCVVYQYSPSKSFLEDEPGYLWSLMFFLFNKKRKRVAFVYLIASRLKKEGIERYSFSTNTNKRTTIGYDDDIFQGDYDLTNDENAIADDSENDYLSESELV
ncbi:RNA polymerase III-inhibiting protein MAF1 KNAG_0J01210 [Huiozyma naganishii CBS 8797]|uniref:Repressor of RNA polymerase III transcription MAF1 n=1 Tax=Huiozyma naganishii (strain ATCC MYA-139 / BCRC 22969 / CBS 8797 / KCTC 17520 / NBRC 10181 / NCYC 3082 / Yp74L-3) TaxID=1071383 RepID=J7S2R7_HUIN7|nr:hypothetical protein KNAG_0J01210 [Kazachstania naganishii CBS 8797]CCK72202.1 hypothetical protein KNAG_0J01210 [Kazachstania naganishii CBS 8797]